jgi:hypothetical protein
MPNGVICGGAADGSSQLGAIVTCQAITICPDGSFAPAAPIAPPPTASSPAISEPRIARRERRALNKITIISSPRSLCRCKSGPRSVCPV